MRIMTKNKKSLVEAAMGKRKCSLIIKNGKILNMFTGEIYYGNIGIYDGFICHIECNPDGLNKVEEPLEGEVIFDAKGQYVIPGLIDIHIHIESTMMTPRNFAEAVLVHGTTTVITDPHEIGNVLGVEGVKYMHDSSSDLPMRQYVLAPSCVPSVLNMENAGANFTYKEIEKMFKMERVIGLGEIMDFLGVINNEERMDSIIEMGEKFGGFLQGHAPFSCGRPLSAYLTRGIKSCHESRLPQEARDKIRNGMFVDARESSISKNVKDLFKGVKDFRYLDNFTLCTDDREPEDIVKDGHINYVIKEVIKAGMNPIDAIRSATLNSARELEISNLGAIAPGFVADLVITPSLEDIVPSAVFFNGELVAKDGKIVKEIENMKLNVENKNTVYIDEDLTLEDFKIKAPINEGKIKVNVIKYEDKVRSITTFSEKEVNVVNGYVDLSNNKDLMTVMVINRHKGKNSKAIAIVENFGNSHGAIGSTVSHDCHNMTIVYDKEENALSVLKELKKIGGGITCAVNGKIKQTLALPVAGLMSNKKCIDLAKEALEMKEALRKIGLIEPPNPLLRIATIALPVIPDVKMSDLGIIDVNKQEFINLFIK
ncbi:adenine deaminase [Clostridium tarantellae]|uniref:Adenine deaminase n=2 Tax=Clostridium tarantellae TaxID=39493 RepID=A0A6I1MW18_9CLOT|nr:adenine deaminase [Clostridium tarantellae]